MKLKISNLTTVYIQQTIFNPNFDLNPTVMEINRVFILFRT
jgi:hypothetical protein